MKTTCRNNIIKQLQEIRQLPQNNQIKQCVLVLDGVTSRLLSQLMNLEHLFELGFVDLARADKKKKAHPHAVGIYFINSESFPHLFDDFVKEPTYYSINILLAEEANQFIMKQLSSREVILERLASFGELHLPCTYFSERWAIMRSPSIRPKKSKTLLSHIINKASTQAISAYAKQIFSSLVANWGSISSIQVFYYDSPFSRKTMEHFKIAFSEYEESNPGSMNTGKDLRLVVMDREIDLISPLIYCFEYLPLLCDALKSQINSQTGKIAILDEQAPRELNLEDEIFTRYKDMIIYKTFEHIDTDLKEFIKSSKTAQFQKNNHENANMKEIISEIPEYQNKVKNYTMNIDLMKKIKMTNEAERTEEVCEMQHLITTGFNGKLEQEKPKKIYQKGMTVVDMMKREVDKLRLLIPMIGCLEVNQDERASMMKRIGKMNEQLGAILNRILPKPRKYPVAKTQQQPKCNRHQCTVATTLEELLTFKNPPRMKSFEMGVPPSPVKLSKRKKQKQQLNIIMGGGITLSEISQLQKVGVQQKCEVFILSDKILNAHEYMQQLMLL